MNKEQLLQAVPEFVEKHWPKNVTAAIGGPATPGRGEATVIITRFITEVVPDDFISVSGVSPARDWEVWGDDAEPIKYRLTRQEAEEEALKLEDRDDVYISDGYRDYAWNKTTKTWDEI